MKLEAGMYVRLENDVEDIVIINRIADVFENTILTENDGSIYQGVYTKENVVKASYNIIDILEVGDYVNGEKVIAFKKDIPERNIYFNSKKCNIFTDYSLVEDWYFGIEDKDIKTIVTKEQMERMAYKVGE